MLSILRIENTQAGLFVESYKKYKIDKNAIVIEDCIFEAWDKHMSGNEVIRYVCKKTCAPIDVVTEIYESLLNRMAE